MLDIEKATKLMGAVREEDSALVESWIKEYQLMMEKAEILSHPAISMLLKKLDEEVKAVNTKLSSDRQMSPEDRFYFFAKKDVYEQIAKVFKAPEETMKKIEEVIDEQAKHLDIQ